MGRDMRHKISRGWDPVAEARAAIKAEQELGIRSATPVGERLAAAKLRADEAKTSRFIGNPEWQLDAKRCMEIILEDAVKMRNALEERMGSQRSQDFLIACCSYAAAAGQSLPPRSSKSSKSSAATVKPKSTRKSREKLAKVSMKRSEPSACKVSMKRSSPSASGCKKVMKVRRLR